MIITIDGPVASGKSVIARKLSSTLGYYYINTGYLYRSLAHILTTYYNYTTASLSNPKIDDLNDVLASLNYEYKDGIVYVWYKGEDVVSFLKTLENDNASSIISQVLLVRNLLLPLQKSLSLQHDLVTEGRDCGTKIFPQAEFKFFLNADVLIRAYRWRRDQQKKKIAVSPEEALHFVQTRDRRDIEREHAPLSVPTDALIIDSSTRSIDEVVNDLIAIIQTGRQS